MKRWTKLVAGDEPITAQDIVATALIGMLLGGTITWFLFSAFWGYRVFEDAGSAADWSAALGTWGVGYGAILYARAAHRQAVLKEQMERRREMEERAKSLQKVYFWAITLSAPNKAINEYIHRDGGISIAHVRGIMKSIEELWRDYPVDSPCFSVLDPGLTDKKRSLDLLVRSVKGYASFYTESPENKSSLVDQNEDFFKAMRAAFEDLANAAKDFEVKVRELQRRNAEQWRQN